MQRFHNDIKKIALKFHINLLKYFTKPKNNWIFFTVVSTGHWFKLCTFEPLMHMAFRYNVKTKEHCTVM